MDLRHRLSTLIAARLVVVTVLLGSAILVQISRPGSFPVDPFFFIIGLTYGLSVVYLATLRWAESRPWLVDLQFAADAMLVAAFVHVTGGVTSYFSSLYLLPIIAASMLRFRIGALKVAALSGVLYLALVLAQFNPADVPAGMRFFPDAVLPTARFAQFTVAINLFGFVAVALLSGSLAERVRTADVSLERASTQIEDLRAFNDYVIESLVTGLVTTDGGCRVLTFNRAAATITGVGADDARGRDIRDLLQFPPDARARLGALRETRSVRIELAYRAPQGRAMEIGLTATTLALPGGVAGYLLTFQDVTDVKRLERDVRLRQRLAAVGEMAAGIAHEIRNPLASMSGSIQVLRHELPLTEEQGQLMDIVLRESERLNETIRVFLAYARPQRFAVTRLDVRRVVQDTAVLLRTSPYIRDDHTVDVDVPAVPVWYDADESQLREVLWNLATNGLRAMHRGGRLRVSVSAGEDAPDAGAATGASQAGPLVLAVSDQGCGIAADDLEAIFEPFRGFFENSTGLGLSIVHRIVTEYGGTIDVQTRVGDGTTMSVHLPASTRAAAMTLDAAHREEGVGV